MQKWPDKTEILSWKRHLSTWSPNGAFDVSSEQRQRYKHDLYNPEPLWQQRLPSAGVTVQVYGGIPAPRPGPPAPAPSSRLCALDQPASLWAVSVLSTSLNLTAAINRGSSGSSLAWQHCCLIPPPLFGGTRLTADAPLREREGRRVCRKGRSFTRYSMKNIWMCCNVTALCTVTS